MLRNIFLTNAKLLLRYDSVIFNGQVRWQDRLNSYNLPFFLPSTGFFTNYTVSTGTQSGASILNSVDLSGPQYTRLSPRSFSLVWIHRCCPRNYDLAHRKHYKTFILALTFGAVVLTVAVASVPIARLNT
jgi:hypothetical protein